uniref:Uncharacterized protein n=1 Tax=Rhizophora mucronata TaxID=61149 RepID=A0A2P2QIX6_RHIMU
MIENILSQAFFGCNFKILGSVCFDKLCCIANAFFLMHHVGIWHGEVNCNVGN